MEYSQNGAKYNIQYVLCFGDYLKIRHYSLRNCSEQIVTCAIWKEIHKSYPNDFSIQCSSRSKFGSRCINDFQKCPMTALQYFTSDASALFNIIQHKVAINLIDMPWIKKDPYKFRTLYLHTEMQNGEHISKIVLVSIPFLHSFPQNCIQF